MMRMEFIGKKVRVNGIEGTVLDETKHLLIITTEKGTKKVNKNGAQFTFIIDGKEMLVAGSRIVARPEDRIQLK